jgi:riboflavin biosynthesis pyrimidine reductase
MTIVATLVVGADGSSTLAGSSEAISSPADRERFLTRRRLFDCLIIGGNTARSDRYQKTPVPLIILSHTRPDLMTTNPIAHWWNLPPKEAIARAREVFGEKIQIEAGISIILELLNRGLIDQLELSVTQVQGGENRIVVKEFLQFFTVVDKTYINGTTFYSCSIPLMSKK